jgi:ABC-2 type transport system permease protein
MSAFSLARFSAVFFKEFVQMRRDRLTFAIMIMVPIMQLVLFGYAINTDPRHMALVVVARETSSFQRSLLASLKASSFFDIVGEVTDAGTAEAMMQAGHTSFILEIPAGFEERLVAGKRPQLLLAADATDPVASGGALGAIDRIAAAAFAPHFVGALQFLAAAPPPYDLVVQRRYNPAGATALNIVPGLLGIILTMTLVMMSSIGLTREAERGTLETLLSTPVRPLEVMIGKTTPYIFIGAIQISIVLIAARLLFDVPFEGPAIALLAGLSLFVAVNLILGFLISTAAKSQLQAMQMTFFLFLPSILLSGFMFPFRAMPVWARGIGEVLPITHFLRIVREVMLKGAGPAEIAGDLWPLALMLFVLSAVALVRYRRTLD